jgi:hypothetical protein
MLRAASCLSASFLENSIYTCRAENRGKGAVSFKTGKGAPVFESHWAAASIKISRPQDHNMDKRDFFNAQTSFRMRVFFRMRVLIKALMKVFLMKVF